MHRTVSTGGALEPVRSIDLATALGVGLEEAAQNGRIAAVMVCAGPFHRRAFTSFLAGQGVTERCIQEAHPQATAFLVHLDEEPVGAAALLPDSQLGLPLPDGFQPTLTRLRRDGRQLALLDPLVIPAELPARGAGLVMRALLRLALLTARRIDGRSDILVRCEPRYARFFAQVLLFAVEADQLATEDSPAQLLLRLDLDLCPGAWQSLYGDGPWSPYGMYAKPTPQAARVVAWLRRHRQPPSLNDLIATWIDPIDGSPPADRESLAALRRLYPGLSEHLTVRRSATDSWRTVRAAGTGPVPRVRTPLPPDAASRVTPT